MEKKVLEGTSTLLPVKFRDAKLYCVPFIVTFTILLGERVREALEARMVKSENWRCIPELKDFKVHIHPKAWLDCMPTSPVYSNPSKIRRLCDQPLSAMHLSHCSDMHGKRPPLRRYFKK